MSYQQLLDDFGTLFLGFEQRAVMLLPRLAGALLILLVGLALAYLFRFLSRRLIGELHRLVPGERLQRNLRRLGMEARATQVVGRIVFWIVAIFFLTAATETLGLPVVTTWLGGIGTYLPRFLSAVLIALAGLIGGLFLRGLITTAASSAGLAYAATLGRLAQIAALLVGLLVAVEQAGLNLAFLTSTLLILFGAILFGGALAFALGARTSVANILASHYVQKTYRIGHRVRIGDTEGEIVQITPTAVILEAAEGRVTVPAKRFDEAVSVLLIERS